MNKKLGAMQPYLFPYIGYFQLMNEVDIYVIADAMQYMKKGWVNRNYIRNEDMMDKKRLFVFSLVSDDYKKNINERFFSEDFELQKKKFLKQMYYIYHKAPFYTQTMELLKQILEFKDRNVASFTINSIMNTAKYLGITTPIVKLSEISLEKANEKINRSERIELLCKHFGADEYINAIGGTKLYDKNWFLKHGIKIYFLETGDIKYQQFGEEFVPNLSILDVMMFNSVEVIRGMLKQYRLI